MRSDFRDRWIGVLDGRWDEESGGGGVQHCGHVDGADVVEIMRTVACDLFH